MPAEGLEQQLGAASGERHMFQFIDDEPPPEIRKLQLKQDRFTMIATTT
jgi:hypothetical protein